MRILIVIVLMLLTALAHGQTHTMPGSNVVPSGASLTINSGGSITAAAGSTVTGFGGGGGGNVSNSGTPTVGQKALWVDATHIQGVTDNALQWDGGSTSLVAATGRTSLGGTTVGQSFFTLTNPGAITFPEISATNVVSAKTAAQLKTDLSLTSTDVGLGSVTNNAQTQAAIVPNTPPGAGQILAGNAGATAYAPVTVSGSGATISLASTGTMTISAIAKASITGAPSGNFVGDTDTQTLTNKRNNPRVTSIASNATWSPSATTDDIYEITAQAAPVTTISNPAGTPVDGQSLIIRFSDNGTARALTWSGTQWEAGPGVSLPTTTVVGKHDYAGFKWNSTTSKWTMLASSQDAAVLNAGTGFTIGGAAASGKILVGNGTNFVASTPTYPNAASPTAGKLLISDGTNWTASTPTYPTTAGTAAYEVRSDGTNYAAYPSTIINGSTSSQSPSTSDVYLAGSNAVVAAGDFKQKGQYKCVFDVTKSAGTGAIVISVRAGTAGTTADTAQLTFTFGAGTSVADTGIFEVIVNWRSVGSGTSAVLQGVCRAQKNAATTTGLWNNTGTDLVIVATTSSGFASNTFTNMGVSFNGGTAFAGTVTLVQATLLE